MTEALQMIVHPLPALLVFWPLACALAVYPLGRWNPGVRDWFMVFATMGALAGAAALIPLVTAEKRVGFDIPVLIGEISFMADPFGMLFALFTTFVWVCATLYSLDYLKHEKNHDRYHCVSLIALSGMLGVVLAADLITLYLFFEVLGLIAFLFVIHTQTDKAKSAAIKYLWMTVLGGLALVAGIFLTFGLGGDGSLLPITFDEGNETLRWVAFGFLLAGFGVKAGMLPLHTWLPDAHPVAPAPASALLSGVMIKAGAYGIFRTVTALFRPELIEDASEAIWAMAAQLALVVLWLGIATMVVGVILALGQHNAKRMLAYHSVSQMGFILVGIGTAGYLGAEGGMGLAGGVYHIINHALFKAALFLGIGAVAFRTGELDMYKLGGLWRKMPITFGFMLIAAAGITGVPLFNGFVSKCMIHHALVWAYEVEYSTALFVAEKIFLLVCGGTACSFIKLIGFTFLGKPKMEYGAEVTEAPPRMLAGLGLLAAAVIALGVYPQLLLKGVFAPGLEAFALSTKPLTYFLDKYFLSPADLITTAGIFVLGFVIFAAGVRFHLFHLHAPRWFGVNHWYIALAENFVKGCGLAQRAYEAYLRHVSWMLDELGAEYLQHWKRTSRRWRRFLITAATGAPGPRTQRFISSAYIDLEKECRSTVRYSVERTHEWLRICGDLNTVEGQDRVEAVRGIAVYMAQRLLNTRLAVLAEVVRTGKTEVARMRFPSVMEDVKVFRSTIAHTAMELAERRMAGEDVLAEISSAVNALLSEERFDLRLVQTPDAHGALPVLQQAAFRSQEALSGISGSGATTRWHAYGLGRVEHAARYLLDLTRIAIEAATQERTGWAMYEQVDLANVVATRKQIQRYVRDMSFNMAMILVFFLLFMSTILAGMAR